GSPTQGYFWSLLRPASPMPPVPPRYRIEIRTSSRSSRGVSPRIVPKRAIRRRTASDRPGHLERGSTLEETTVSRVARASLNDSTMLATALSATLVGLDAHLIRVEVEVSRGVPSFELVGLAEASVRESRVRVKSALAQVGVDL